MTVSIWEKDDDVEISIAGRFDFNLHKAFRDAYRERDARRTRFSVNLREVEYLDSSALGMLLLLREHAGTGTKVRIRNCTPPVKRLLELARFDQLFEI